MGLYQGFSLETPEQKARLIEVAREKYDLLLLGAGANSIRTRPSLSVTYADIDLFLELLGKALIDIR
jgi:acetylornithine/succinyldiaminopimelate/putrescine aminotransferase